MDQSAPTEAHRGAGQPDVGLRKERVLHAKPLSRAPPPGPCYLCLESALYTSMFEVFALAFASKAPLKFHLALANLGEKDLRQGEFVRGQMLLGDIVAPETKGS